MKIPKKVTPAWIESRRHPRNRPKERQEGTVPGHEGLVLRVEESGAVKGGGYYVERPPRLDEDGVTQPHAMDAFRRAAALNRVAGDKASARRFDGLAQRIRANFVTRWWRKDRFAEYMSPEHGAIDGHGLTDTDWAAMAFGAADREQEAALWPRLRSETRFYYGGMPTGIATEPEKYEASAGEGS